MFLLHSFNVVKLKFCRNTLHRSHVCYKISLEFNILRDTTTVLFNVEIALLIIIIISVLPKGRNLGCSFTRD